MAVSQADSRHACGSLQTRVSQGRKVTGNSSFSCHIISDAGRLTTGISEVYTFNCRNSSLLSRRATMSTHRETDEMRNLHDPIGQLDHDILRRQELARAILKRL